MKWIKTRNNILWGGVFLLMLVLAFRLFFLTVVEGAKWDEAASNLSVKSITTSAPRGEILDRYGRLLAGNRASFTVQFSEGDLTDEQINAQALSLMKILEQDDDTINDNLPIIIENGNFYYTYDRQIEAWLLSQEMPVTYDAQGAFDELRRNYSIDDELDKYDAQEELLNSYNVSPPISVARMKFTYELEKEKFIGRYFPKGDDQTEEEAYGRTAEDIFDSLRTKFKIDESLSDADARRIMVVRNELHSLGYMSYLPAKIASGIKEDTIITLEEKNLELSGVEIIAESERYYPYEKTAAHVLGYLGKIAESEKEYYQEKGYNTTDIVGKEGIEYAFEEDLKGKDGIKNVEVNAYGEAVRTINEEAAEKGKDVYLTIDLDLQVTAEEALEKALKGIQTAGTFESQWGNYKYSRSFPNANVGSAVALDVKTGEVLALANYPAYDPNLFVHGISNEDWQSLQPDNPRDPLAPLPLFNVAANTAVQPGSTFKMVTALAALENGFNPRTKLEDKGYISYGERTYGCVIWNDYRSRHGYIDLYTAIEVSCNYYFYDLGTGKDWARSGNPSLGIGSMGIETITEYATMLGLGESTGIEIGDKTVPAPTAAQKTTNMETSVRNILIGRAETYFEKEVADDAARLQNEIDEIVSWVRENPSRSEIIKRLENLSIRDDMVSTVADELKYTYFNFAEFNEGDVMNISIGQGENAYTPLQMANYVATIGNSGVLNKTNVVRAVEGKGVIEKEAGVKADIDDAHLDDVIEGMRRVAHGSKGSVRSMFSSFPVQVAAKTGTAQRAGKVPPPDEVEYIKQYLSRINNRLSFDDVEVEMYRLLEKYPETFRDKNSAVDQAVINLSRAMGLTMNYDKINRYKSDYDNYAWFVAMAPAEDPQIAVAVLIFQGGTAANAGPAAREIIGAYLDLDAEYEDYSLNTTMTQ